MENLVRLENLITKPFYFHLSRGCRETLLNKALKNKKNIKDLAKEINCCTRTLKDFLRGETKHGRKFIEAGILKNLLTIAKTSSEEIERRVLALKRGCNTRDVEIKLPIRATPELALLFAKAIGDGCVCSDWRFNYDNKERVLIDEIIKTVQKTIGKTSWTLYTKDNGCYNIKFSPVIGYILHLCGVIKGYKINSKFDIPKWIKNSDKEIKRYFIRGLFDDEACVHYSKKHRTKRIIFAMSKSNSHKRSLENFLNLLREFLNEFGIKASDVHLQKKYGNKIILRFGIYGKENLEKFEREIKLTHSNKRKILVNMLETYVDIFKTKNSIHGIVIKSEKPLTTLEIANLSNVNYDLTKYHLLNLARDGRISKTKNAKPTFWWISNNRLMNKKERIIELLSKKQLTALKIAEQLNINQRHIFWLLNKLEKENLIFPNDSHPRIWRVK